MTRTIPRLSHTVIWLLTISQPMPRLIFRKGVSLYNLKDYDTALTSFLKAKDSAGASDSQINKYINMCHQANKVETQKMKATYQNMFKQMAV
ncbi:hypothetical protein EB796_024248 [Bugula neritina]|uniref:Uncharacterized protein n=1 Tax=Bugula neritina TaxID=10212 RepID=A0A7J7IW28_BUGNE|nr:hypothetical protein EB796_024248 [Bugula neritina]